VQVFFVFALAHPGRPSANDIDPAQLQRLNEIAILSVLIKIQRNFHS
jgi:hypothetical protein